MSLLRAATADRQVERRRAERKPVERKIERDDALSLRRAGRDDGRYGRHGGNGRHASASQPDAPQSPQVGAARRDAVDTAGSSSCELHDDRLLTQHIRALRRYAYALVGGSSIADDLVQETLARAIFYLRAGREVRNLRSYLLTILHNVRVDYIKSDRRQGDLLPLDEHPQLAVPAAQLDQLECNEVAAAIDALPEDQREVLLLIGLEGLSYQEATEILGVPLGTVMSRLNRGRNAVKAHLGRDDAARSPRILANPPSRRSSPANAWGE
jgi:RNA polymerase sigma-70 factor (ECF subfamily)